MCCQSLGMPFSFLGEPPPHRRPLDSTIWPQKSFCSAEGNAPIEISSPVAGQVRCVERSSLVAGRPARANSDCSSAVRYPEMIQTGTRVKLVKSSAARKVFRISVSSTLHVAASTQGSDSVITSREGTGHQLGTGTP